MCISYRVSFERSGRRSKLQSLLSGTVPRSRTERKHWSKQNKDGDVPRVCLIVDAAWGLPQQIKMGTFLWGFHVSSNSSRSSRNSELSVVWTWMVLENSPGRVKGGKMSKKDFAGLKLWKVVRCLSITYKWRRQISFELQVSTHHRPLFSHHRQR
jgi:hypothetical protein